MKKLLQKLPSAGASPLRIRKILEWGCACGLLLTIVLTAAAVRYQTVCARVCGDTLRLHILANSDTVEDQLLKLQVRDAVLEQVTAATQYAETKQQAVQTLRTAMPTCSAQPNGRCAMRAAANRYGAGWKKSRLQPAAIPVSGCRRVLTRRCGSNWAAPRGTTGSVCCTRRSAWAAAKPGMRIRKKTRWCLAAIRCGLLCWIPPAACGRK